MAQNFLIIIAHLRHALCALLAQADTMTAAAAGKYEFSIRNGADAHVVNRIGFIIGILRRLCCIHINGKLFPIQIGKRALCFCNNALPCHRRKQTALRTCARAARYRAALAVNRKHLARQRAAGRGKIGPNGFLRQRFCTACADDLHLLHPPACGKLRNHNILRCADILTLRLQKRSQLIQCQSLCPAVIAIFPRFGNRTQIRYRRIPYVFTAFGIAACRCGEHRFNRAAVVAGNLACRCIYRRCGGIRLIAVALINLTGCGVAELIAAARMRAQLRHGIGARRNRLRLQRFCVIAFRHFGRHHAVEIFL